MKNKFERRTTLREDEGRISWYKTKYYRNLKRCGWLNLTIWEERTKTSLEERYEKEQVFWEMVWIFSGRVWKKQVRDMKEERERKKNVSGRDSVKEWETASNSISIINLMSLFLSRKKKTEEENSIFIACHSIASRNGFYHYDSPSGERKGMKGWRRRGEREKVGERRRKFDHRTKRKRRKKRI